MCEITFRPCGSALVFVFLFSPGVFAEWELLFTPPPCFLMLISAFSLCSVVEPVGGCSCLTLYHRSSSLMNLFCFSAAFGRIIRLKSPGPLGAPESDPAAADRRKIKTQNAISRLRQLSCTEHSSFDCSCTSFISFLSCFQTFLPSFDDPVMSRSVRTCSWQVSFLFTTYLNFC